MTVPFVALLRRTNDKSDCIKTFDTSGSNFMVFCTILESFIL